MPNSSSTITTATAEPRPKSYWTNDAKYEYEPSSRLSLSGPPRLNAQTWLNARKSQITERVISNRKIGLSIGTVTEVKERQKPAPSISAASYSSRGTWVRPA